MSRKIRFIKYVLHSDVGEWERLGWRVADPAGFHPLDNYKIDMEWLGKGKPAEPKKEKTEMTPSTPKGKK